MAQDDTEVWLVSDGTRLRVGSDGILLGRAPSCDVWLADPAASRHHALVHRDATSISVVAMGRGQLDVNGQPHAGKPLVHDDVLDLPGLCLRIEVGPGSPPTPTWFVGVVGGPAVRVSRAGFTVGQGGDLDLEGVPHRSLTLDPGPSRLHITSTVPWSRNGHPIAPGTRVGLLTGDALEVRSVQLHVTHQDAAGATTRTLDQAPDHVVLEFLPRGGRLRVGTGSNHAAVFLAERRFALMVSVLKPPEPHGPGDPIPDEVVIRQVWPRQAHKSRVDLNVLVGRLRRALDEAGIPGQLIERSGDGGTRFRLAPGATVELA